MPDRTTVTSAEKSAFHLTLSYQVEAGADEAVGESSIDRFALAPPPATQPAPPPAPVHPTPPTWPVRLEATGQTVATAREIARGCGTLDELRDAVHAFDGCTLKHTAMSTVFSDGAADGRLMLIGEAPGAEEDRQGKPFVGASGQILDKMLNAINLNRETDAYITNIVFWRPPGNREPSATETAVCRPFLERHIELKKPDVLVFLGGPSAKTVLNRTEGITRLRGRWFDYRSPDMEDGAAAPIPAMPLFHPAYLLRSPTNKREAWRDLLAIKDKLASTE